MKIIVMVLMLIIAGCSHWDNSRRDANWYGISQEVGKLTKE